MVKEPYSVGEEALKETLASIGEETYGWSRD